jgi:hypothetical protein
MPMISACCLANSIQRTAPMAGESSEWTISFGYKVRPTSPAATSDAGAPSMDAQGDAASSTQSPSAGSTGSGGCTVLMTSQTRGDAWRGLLFALGLVAVRRLRSHPSTHALAPSRRRDIRPSVSAA